MSGPDPFWTETVTAEFLRLWDTGASISTIAAALGPTRNAVAGRRFRLGLPPRPQLKKEKRTMQQKPEPETPPIPMPPPRPTPPPPSPPGVAVLDVQYGQCRWPINPEGTAYRFCGGDREYPHFYCTAHATLAFRGAYRRGEREADVAAANLSGVQRT